MLTTESENLKPQAARSGGDDNELPQNALLHGPKRGAFAVRSSSFVFGNRRESNPLVYAKRSEMNLNSLAEGLESAAPQPSVETDAMPPPPLLVVDSTTSMGSDESAPAKPRRDRPALPEAERERNVLIADAEASRRERQRLAPLVDLACSDCGGKILFATDEWFASADKLIKPLPPVFEPDAYTEYGKKMDGWESRRRRLPGHDFCIIELGTPGFVRGIRVDTTHFTGNFAPAVSIQVAYLREGEVEALNLPSRKYMQEGCGEPLEVQKRVDIATKGWAEILSMVELRPGYRDEGRHTFTVSHTERITHVRVNLYPDGGVARIRLPGIVAIDWDEIPESQVVELSSVRLGGLALACSDAHFGRPQNLIASDMPENMGGGWETARKFDRPRVLESDDDGCLKVPGEDWAIFRLGCVGIVERVIVDTMHFKGNFPESFKLEAICSPLLSDDAVRDGSGGKEVPWRTLIQRSRLSADTEHVYDLNGRALAADFGPVSHVKLRIFPDGGVARLRILGRRTVAPEETLQHRAAIAVDH